MIQTRKIAALAALVAVVGVSGYAVGQNTQADDPQTFEKEIYAVDAGLGGFGDIKPDEQATRAAAIGQKAAGNAALTNAVVRQAFLSQRTGRDQFNSLKLQALQIAQNQKIIELLERQSPPKTGVQ